MRVIFLFSLLSLCLYTHAQQNKDQTLPQPAKFKTASQAAKEDSISTLIKPPKPVSTNINSTRKYDTAAWGALLMVGFSFVSPQGELKEISNNGFGYGFHAGMLVNLARRRNPFRWDKKRASIYAGADLGYLKQGGVIGAISKSDMVAKTEVFSVITNTLWSGNLIARVEVLPYQFKLFAEASVGGSFFTSNHRVVIESTENTSPNLTNKTEFTFGAKNDWIPQYAYGGGFRTGDETMKIEFKLMNHIGQSVQYVDVETIQHNTSDNTYSFSTTKTATTLLLPQISVTYLF